jgi:hypothetical protein
MFLYSQVVSFLEHLCLRHTFSWQLTITIKSQVVSFLEHLCLRHTFSWQLTIIQLRACLIYLVKELKFSRYPIWLKGLEYSEHIKRLIRKLKYPITFSYHSCIRGKR